jgi:hypothetical protein
MAEHLPASSPVSSLGVPWNIAFNLHEIHPTAYVNRSIKGDNVRAARSPPLIAPNGKVVLVVRSPTAWQGTGYLTISFACSCAPFFHVDSWVGMFSIFTVNVILLLRTWAIWGKSRLVLGCLATLLTVSILGLCEAYNRQTTGSIALYNRSRWCCYLCRYRYVSRLTPTSTVSFTDSHPPSSRPKWALPQAQNVFTLLSSPVDYPVPGNVRPCATSFKRTDVLYAIWISSIVWDTGTSPLGLATSPDPW